MRKVKKMGIMDKDMFGVCKYEQSIQFLKYYCEGKKVLCAFSGGKDSQCCYHLLKDAGIPFTAQYSITRFEPPELISFIRENYPDCEFRRAYRTSLIKEIEYGGLPNRWYRWCCNAKHAKVKGYDISIIGVRAEESARRRETWRVFGQKRDRTYYCCPIFSWTDDDVWEYLNEIKKVKHCCLYDEGFKRIGCICCPLAKHNDEDIKRFPKMVNVLRIGNRMFWNRIVSVGGKTIRGKPYKILGHKNADAAFEHWLKYMTTDPYTIEVKEEQGCLFEGTGFSEKDGQTEMEELE